LAIDEEEHVSDRLWERIESARQRWDVLRHPFYRRWSAGELEGDELARYAGQYRHAVEAIADLSEAVAGALPQRPELARHAAEEREHVALWDGFVTAANGTAAGAASEETAACARAWSAAADAPSLLARLYAVESAQPEIARVKRDGLVGLYGFAEGEGTAYFSVHERLDHEHAAEVRELLDELAAEADEDELVAAAEAAYRANWRLLDGI
jgi:pyrroloquinoline-quinone synthase